MCDCDERHADREVAPTLSPWIFLKSASDSFMDSTTPFSSKTMTGTTNMVTRLQTPPAIAAAILPARPSRFTIALRTSPEGVAGSSKATYDRDH